MVGAAGQLLERSIVDRMVGGPERLVFEGGPMLVPPLQQDRRAGGRSPSMARCSTRWQLPAADDCRDGAA